MAAPRQLRLAWQRAGRLSGRTKCRLPGYEVMRYAIRRSSESGELWLIRATAQGVWGQQANARKFFTRATAEKWAARYKDASGAAPEVAAIEQAAADSTAESGNPALAAV